MQTKKQTLSIFNDPITLSFRKGNKYDLESLIAADRSQKELSIVYHYMVASDEF
jgi:hypothetical protein